MLPLHQAALAARGDRGVYIETPNESAAGQKWLVERAARSEPRAVGPAEGQLGLLSEG